MPRAQSSPAPLTLDESEWCEFDRWQNDPDRERGEYFWSELRGTWCKAPPMAQAQPQAPPAAGRRASSPAGYLTLSEAGELACAAPETVRYWIWRGRLTAYKPGRSVLVRKDELLALVAGAESVGLRADKLRSKATPSEAANRGAKVGQRSQR